MPYRSISGRRSNGPASRAHRRLLPVEAEKEEEEEEEADASDLLPLLLWAALVVVSGSGTLPLLVFLVTFLCSLRFRGRLVMLGVMAGVNQKCFFKFVDNHEIPHLPVDTEADVPVVLVVRVHWCRLHLVEKTRCGQPMS